MPNPASVADNFKRLVQQYKDDNQGAEPPVKLMKHLKAKAMSMALQSLPVEDDDGSLRDYAAGKKL